MHGLLLGDGSFLVSAGGCALQMCSSHFDFPEWCRRQLHVPGATRLVKNSVGGKAFARWQWSSPYTGWLFREWARWWPRGAKRKRVPEEVRIDSASALVWWLGDGTLKNGGRTPTLCTDGFAREDVGLLGIKLSQASGCDWTTKLRHGHWEFTLPRHAAERDEIENLGRSLEERSGHRWVVREAPVYWRLKIPFNAIEPALATSLLREVVRPANNAWRLMRASDGWRLALPSYQVERWFAWLPPRPAEITSLARRWPDEMQRRRYANAHRSKSGAHRDSGDRHPRLQS